MKKKLIKQLKKDMQTFEFKHKIISLIIVLAATITLSRISVLIADPNLMIKGMELHHFHYGLILLVFTSLLMLYKKGTFNYR